MNLDVPNISSLSLTTLPTLVKAGRWRLETLRAWSHHRLYWVTYGQGHATYNGRRRGFAANTLLFFPAGSVHSVTFGAKGQVQGTLITLPANLDPALQIAPMTVRAESMRDQAEIGAAIERIANERRAMEPGADLAIRATLQLLSVWMIRKDAVQRARDASPRKASQKLAAAYAELVEKKFRAAPGVGALAETLGVTPTHLSRVCRECYGLSAQAFLQRRVALQARLDLGERGRSVQDVARGLGFSSPAYFSRFVAAQTGKAPRDLRLEN